MHIPDGYLSPSTCATMYAAAIPFWATAMRNMHSLLRTRMVPMISLMAAFSFVIMMFNFPLPGGTTGHATGVGIAAIVLGPWGAMLAISVALAIQTFFFGDGGITALGANCFNIAIAGSLAAHFTWRLLNGSKRPALAAGLAGYVAINTAALLTAIEAGIQPLLFSGADGTPLYAPYPLSITIPAIMISHLTIAGLAEAIVTGGIVLHLMRNEPSMLHLTARPAISLRPMWIGLTMLMLATPIGLLASGVAFGEDGGTLLWTAPIPDYAPPFVNASFGYILSAMFGTGLILLTVLLMQRLSGFRERGSL
jgi:cobalt/nickel transport system permease protein